MADHRIDHLYGKTPIITQELRKELTDNNYQYRIEEVQEHQKVLLNNNNLYSKFETSIKCLQKGYKMEQVGKESKRQHQLEEESKRLDEAAKKK